MKKHEIQGPTIKLTKQEVVKKFHVMYTMFYQSQWWLGTCQTAMLGHTRSPNPLTKASEGLFDDGAIDS